MPGTRKVDPVTEARGRPLSDSVLELLWREGQASRADIARKTGLSRSTVSDIVSGLLASGLVVEAGDGPSRGGRRPILLRFQDQEHVILGIEMGASHLTVVLTDLRGRVLGSTEVAHPVRTDPEGTAERMIALARSCLSECDGCARRLLGVGVAAPCPVDPREPDRLSDVVMPAWRGFKLTECLASAFGVPIFLDNDANLGALAEHWWGAGREWDDFTYVKLGTGVGAGHLIRGEIYRGSSGVTGEIGHLSLDPNGPPCVCGNRGCLATFIGSAALVERARALLPEYPRSLLAGDEVDIDAIEDAALADDPLAMRVVREAADHLGSAIAGVLNLLNPSAVILGGGLSRVGDRLVVPVREAVISRTLVSSVAAAQIRVTELGPRAVALGAATQVLARALSDPSLFPGMAGR
ncbi:MAG TPA: ROK family transcriptional regulator [Longimicrobiales bacterium]|nr:ROK family transcriptional regulator [Longimicrobiales bacterium]